MMRKFCFPFLVTSMILLMVSFSLAQTPRQPTSSEGKTTFTNIAVTGLDKNGSNGETSPGLPGYIEMTSSAGDVYYLWIGYNGELKIASDRVVGLSASPTITSWRDASGVTVGTQRGTLP